MKDIKNKLNSILEQLNCDKPACKNCKSYKNGGCSFGCVNERLKITTPNYSCNNFDAVYEFNERTKATLTDLLKDVERVDEGMKNLELLLAGKITETDFNDIVD